MRLVERNSWSWSAIRCWPGPVNVPSCSGSASLPPPPVRRPTPLSPATSTSLRQVSFLQIEVTHLVLTSTTITCIPIGGLSVSVPASISRKRSAWPIGKLHAERTRQGSAPEPSQARTHSEHRADRCPPGGAGTHQAVGPGRAPPASHHPPRLQPSARNNTMSHYTSLLHDGRSLQTLTVGPALG